MICIIDYGMGNLQSLNKAFRRCGVDAVISKSLQDIQNAKKLILPGVGHFKQGMQNLKESGILPVLKQKILNDKTPVLGICLGMQLLTSFSEEGNCDGLNLIDASVIHFKNLGLSREFKIPHIGWNSINSTNSNELLNNLDGEMMYFVHSYAVKCNVPEDVICETFYGITFHSGFRHDNIYGLQFHPEKSHKSGLNIIRNFLKL